MSPVRTSARDFCNMSDKVSLVSTVWDVRRGVRGGLKLASVEAADVRLHAAGPRCTFGRFVVQGTLSVELPCESSGLVPEVAQGLGAEPVAPPSSQDAEQEEPHEHLFHDEILSVA